MTVANPRHTISGEPSQRVGHVKRAKRAFPAACMGDNQKARVPLKEGMSLVGVAPALDIQTRAGRAKAKLTCSDRCGGNCLNRKTDEEIVLQQSADDDHPI
jgi:hypothetical protein